jgi:hypothetical protein
VVERFTEYVIAFLELLEAEGRSAGRGTIIIATKLALLVGGGIVLTVALVVLGWSLFLALESVWGRAWAAFACALLLLLLGGGLMWFANRPRNSTK